MVAIFFVADLLVVTFVLPKLQSTDVFIHNLLDAFFITIIVIPFLWWLIASLKRSEGMLQKSG